MSIIRYARVGEVPNFPPTDQHPDAARFFVIGDKVAPAEAFEKGTVPDFSIDAIGQPSIEEVKSFLNPPPPPMTAQEKLTAAGLTVDDLRELLGLKS